jgi:hypothetical protein
MPGPSVVQLIGQINYAVESLEVRYRVGDLAATDIQDLKGTVDDARLRLWALLKASADDPRFEERHRLRRLTELCVRLTADLDLGLIRPRQQELETLRSAATALLQKLEQADRSGD